MRSLTKLQAVLHRYLEPAPTAAREAFTCGGCLRWAWSAHTYGPHGPLTEAERQTLRAFRCCGHEGALLGARRR